MADFWQAPSPPPSCALSMKPLIGRLNGHLKITFAVWALFAGAAGVFGSELFEASNLPAGIEDSYKAFTGKITEQSTAK